MHAPAVRNDVVPSAAHAAEAHDIVNDTMRLAVQHRDIVPDRGYTMHCMPYQ